MLMSLRSLRRTLRAPRMTATGLLTLLIAALVYGLLAMHVLASGAGNHNDASAMSMGVAHEVVGTSAAVPSVESASASDACPGGCGPVHSMGAMTCVLMLTVPGLLLAIIRPTLSRTLELNRLPEARAQIVPRAVPEPLPPDLLVLSVSRT